jgi:hypothetical protein
VVRRERGADLLAGRRRRWLRARRDTTQCAAPTGFVANDKDCDDTNAAIRPGADDVCNGADDDCDGVTDPGAPIWYGDSDGDGYGNPMVSQVACERPGTAVLDDTDCDDANATISPGAPEICDGLDNDCDEATDEDFDADGDGHAPIGACDAGDDCDDANPDVFPGAPELCNDAVDNDCDGNKSVCLFSGPYDLEDATAKRYADDANFDAGWKLEAADFDGDGKEDLATSAYYANSYHGGAYVLLRPDSGSSRWTSTEFSFPRPISRTRGHARSAPGTSTATATPTC